MLRKVTKVDLDFPEHTMQERETDSLNAGWH